MDKEQLTEQAIQKALEWASAAEGFVVEQAPELCREIVALGRVQYTAIACLGLAIVAWASIRGLRDTVEGLIKVEPGDVRWGRFVPGFLSVVCGVIFLFLFTVWADPLSTVWFAPRLYVLEVLKEIM